jgi:DNA integrity scanning protein DisA with diadenylate cyclase activity
MKHSGLQQELSVIEIDKKFNSDITLFIDAIKILIQVDNFNENYNYIRNSVFDKIIEFIFIVFHDKSNKDLAILKYFFEKLIKSDNQNKIISYELILQSITSAFIQLYFNDEGIEKIVNYKPSYMKELDGPKFIIKGE